MKYHTYAIVIEGAICGTGWGARVPSEPSYLPFTESIRHLFTPEVKWHEVLRKFLAYRGGDFDGPSFTADTVVKVCRRYDGEMWGRTHYRRYSVLKIIPEYTDEETLLSDILANEDF